MRMKKGLVEDLDLAIDLKKMARLVDRVGEVFEEEDLTADEAVWAAALTYLSIFNATDDFANAGLLNAAARALLKEATDVFESLPEPGAEGAEAPVQGEEEEEEEEEDEDEDEEEEEEEGDEGEGAEAGVEADGTEIPDA